MTLTPQVAVHSAQSRTHGRDFSVYAGSSRSEASHLSLSSPISQGLGKVSRCDRNTELHSEEEATGQRGAKDLHRVHIFTVGIYDLTPTQSRFRTDDSSTFNRTVSCLHSRLVFSERHQTWMSRRQFPWMRALQERMCMCDCNRKRRYMKTVMLDLLHLFISQIPYMCKHRNTLWITHRMTNKSDVQRGVKLNKHPALLHSFCPIDIETHLTVSLWLLLSCSSVFLSQLLWNGLYNAQTQDPSLCSAMTSTENKPKYGKHLFFNVRWIVKTAEVSSLNKRL